MTTPILVITGPSGVGKGTLIKGLLERVPGLELAVSATTRKPRAGEVDGRRLPLPRARRTSIGGSPRASSSSTPNTPETATER